MAPVDVGPVVDGHDGDDVGDAVDTTALKAADCASDGTSVDRSMLAGRRGSR